MVEQDCSGCRSGDGTDGVEGGANIGVTGGAVKQKIVSTSQIISQQSVPSFLHQYPQIAVLIVVELIRKRL
jgi:hypothetical protein